MKRKWQSFLSIMLYIIILTCALDFDIFKLIDMKLIFLTLTGTVILTAPFYEKGIAFSELVYIFGRRAIETGLIQTFLLLFARLQNDAGYNRLLGDIALCFRPLLYGFCLFILLAERLEEKQSDNVKDKTNSKSEETISGMKTGERLNLQDFAKFYRLTKRETEITQLILQGKSNADIGSILFISETTVKKHVSNIFDKTGASRREEIIIRIHNE